MIATGISKNILLQHPLLLVVVSVQLPGLPRHHTKRVGIFDQSFIMLLNSLLRIYVIQKHFHARVCVALSVCSDLGVRSDLDVIDVFRDLIKI